MAKSRDFIPQNWAAFAVWFANFIAQLQVLAAKYSVPADRLAQVVKDNDWAQYWVEARMAAKQQENQLANYFTEIVGGNLGEPSPSEPVWTLPARPPAIVPTGIKPRIREIANGIKSQKSIYTRADGELLGIVTAEEANLVETDYTPELKLRSLTNFGIEADFRKFGLDAIRIEYRHKNGAWLVAATLTSSPGIFNIVPTVAGDAEQIEIRAIFILKNQPYGNYSPIYTIVIQP